MAKAKAPAFISHTVLVHAGSYNDFLKKLTTQFPDLQITFCKRKAIHYYILQLEDHSEKGISKKDIYTLPIMAIREEFSSYIIFKNSKGYNNVLKRMCNSDKNEDAPYELFQDLLTPFEKSALIDLEDAKKLQYDEVSEKGETMSTTIYNGINSMKTLNKLFTLNKVKVDDEEKEFTDLVKKLNWQIGIH